MKKILKSLLNYKFMIFFLLVFTAVSTMANLFLPMYLSNIINNFIPIKDEKNILFTGAIMLVFVFISFISDCFVGFFSSKISVGISRDLRSKVFRKIQYFSQIEFDEFSSSSLITRTNNDIVQVQNFLVMLLRIAIMSPIMSIGGIILAFEKNAKMSMILLISIPVMSFFILFVGKKIVPISTEMQKKLDKINLVIREKLTGIRVSRTFGTENFEEEKFEKVNRSFMENAIKMNTLTSLIMPGLNLILSFTTLSLLIFGGIQIFNGNNIPIGDIIAVIQYVIQIMISVIMISFIFMMYPRASVSSKRILEVLEKEIKIKDEENLVENFDKKGFVEFKNVSFTFPNAKHYALENISFKSKPGEITAIIGSTGSGKSTLINLIPRFYDVTCGEILVDGVNVKKMSLKTLREKIGLVPQKAFLFSGTIKENVTYGTENFSDELIKNVLEISQSTNFVMEKEENLEYKISQGAMNVSGGQRQRLSIARALFRKPEIYIFDDSFSALDFKTDLALRNALMKEIKDSTVILVAQRVSTIQNADRILVLEEGKLVGVGKHDELLENCKVYQEIVYSQLSKEEVNG